MLRTIIWLLASILLITFIRGVIGIILKGVGQLFEQESQTPEPRAANTTGGGQGGFGGELMKDPVCGVFVAPSAALTKLVRGETQYFCSAECRDKYAADS